MATRPRIGIVPRVAAQVNNNETNELLNESLKTLKRNDIAALKQTHAVVSKKLAALIVALKEHKRTMIAIGRSKKAVSSALIDLAERSPFWNCTGSNHPERISSLIKSTSKNHQAKVAEFQEFAIDYIIVWERVVKEQVTQHSKRTDSLYRDYKHYRGKVTDLVNKIKSLKVKNKPVPDATNEKLTRNLEKLAEARRLYREAADKQVILLEEFTLRSSRDFLPLLYKWVQFDMDCAHDESVLSGQLKHAVEQIEIQALAQTDGKEFPEQSRLQNLVDAQVSAFIGSSSSNNCDSGNSTASLVEASQEPSFQSKLCESEDNVVNVLISNEVVEVVASGTKFSSSEKVTKNPFDEEEDVVSVSINNDNVTSIKIAGGNSDDHNCPTTSVSATKCSLRSPPRANNPFDSDSDDNAEPHMTKSRGRISSQQQRMNNPFDE